MPIDLDEPTLSGVRARLSPYLTGALRRAGEDAGRVFAEEVALEHLIGALLADEETALCQLVLHAFADPETIARDVLALTPGILVVGSDATLPFSPLGVEAVRRARAAARGAGRREVTEAQLLRGALDALPGELGSALERAGLDATALARAVESEGAGGELPEGKHLFQAFAQEARRALSQAARAAAAARETSIGPARIALAALAAGGLDERVGLGRARAALALQGRTADQSPPPSPRLSAAPELVTFLGELPAAASSLDVLAALHRAPRSELTLAFTRQKVSPELLERARGSFTDPPA